MAVETMSPAVAASAEPALTSAAAAATVAAVAATMVPLAPAAKLPSAGDAALSIESTAAVVAFSPLLLEELGLLHHHLAHRLRRRQARLHVTGYKLRATSYELRYHAMIILGRQEARAERHCRSHCRQRAAWARTLPPP